MLGLGLATSAAKAADCETLRGAQVLLFQGFLRVHQLFRRQSRY
jgi:hypothetical protein